MDMLFSTNNIFENKPNFSWKRVSRSDKNINDGGKKWIVQKWLFFFNNEPKNGRLKIVQTELKKRIFIKLLKITIAFFSEQTIFSKLKKKLKVFCTERTVLINERFYWTNNFLYNDFIEPTI